MQYVTDAIIRFPAPFLQLSVHSIIITELYRYSLKTLLSNSNMNFE